MVTYLAKDEKQEMKLKEKNGVLYFQYETYCRIPWIAHGFSTRIGGVSTGCYASMNLGFLKHEPFETVAENYRRLGAAIGFDWTKAVLSWQTHTTNVRLVTADDAGKGTVRERDYQGIDGLITDVPGIPLVTFYADCVPLYFVDQKHRAIGLSHSGWRGTVKRMGQVTLEAMHQAYKTEPKDVIAAIGPSICGDCFEVGPEVAEAFAQEFTAAQMDRLCRPGQGDRSFLDLWQANRYVLEEAGVLPDHILMANVCTRCNPDLLYSHRIMGPERGNLAAVLMIRE